MVQTVALQCVQVSSHAWQVCASGSGLNPVLHSQTIPFGDASICFHVLQTVDVQSNQVMSQEVHIPFNASRKYPDAHDVQAYVESQASQP